MASHTERPGEREVIYLWSRKCNSPRPPLANIILCGLSLKVLKRVYNGEGLALFRPVPRTI